MNNMTKIITTGTIMCYQTPSGCDKNTYLQSGLLLMLVVTSTCTLTNQVIGSDQM